MAVSTRIIKSRIKSITNTKKITKAMELVSSAKMRRAVLSVQGTRPYSNLSWETVLELAKQVDPNEHPLLRINDKKEKILLVTIFSDRGLCGGFNAQLLRKLNGWEKTKKKENVQIDVVVIGKRGINSFRRAGHNIVASFTNFSNNPTWIDIRPISKLSIDSFVKDEYDEVAIAYTDYKSAVSQIPKIRTLLPISPTESIDGLGEIGEPKIKIETAKKETYEFLFEPNKSDVLEAMLPRLVETQVYQAVLESVASEHSARMFAMANASDAAGEMIDDLTFTFNQARQAGITREISEISAGKAALE